MINSIDSFNGNVKLFPVYIESLKKFNAVLF